MSERKVINKYIPSNYNPDVGLPSSRRGRGHVKFNARKETVWEEDYLGVKIFRFYVRCPMCSAEITYKTDPQNRDYAAEHGAIRNFEPWREEAKNAEELKRLRTLEEEGDPMKALENKTFDSKREIDIMDALDDVRLLNAAHEKVDLDALLQSISNRKTIEELETEARLKREQDEDDEIIKAAFASKKIRISKKPFEAGPKLLSSLCSSISPSSLGIILKK
ncbi:Pre-mRNA-splicing factor cwf16 [Mitosporidium daphniae]